MTIKTIKKLSISFILALSVLSLCGCTGRAYDTSDKQKMEAVGKKRLEEYFAENLPGAKIVSLEAVSANREMTLMVLTNYVHGEYSEGVQTYEYFFDIKNRRMFTSKDYYKLRDRVEEKILEDLDLYDLYLDDKLKILFPNINVYLPDMIEISSFNTDVGNEPGKLPPAQKLMPYPASVYPIEASEDIESYIYDKDRKEIIGVTITFVVDASENIDLTNYSFDRFYYAPHDDNIFYSYLCVNNAKSVTYSRIGYGAEPEIISKDTITARGQSIDSDSYSITYKLWDDIESEEAETQKIIYKKTDTLDINTGNITTKENYSDNKSE